MALDNPTNYIDIQSVENMLTIRQDIAAHECDQLVVDKSPECSISYEAGKRDAYKDALAWLVEYTRPI